MPRQILAITTCRVSTPEQLENNSLDRQAKAVVDAAEQLGAVIPKDGQWSGSVSSKAGTNVYRKDLREMLEYCKKNPQVKYLIVHEVDRFMRSIKELFYFEVEFEKLGVRVWYASQPELNDDDYKTKLLKAFEAFKGEGSNVERQNKSISGQTSALREGRYPFHPKTGYKRGYERGVPEIHPVTVPPLRAVMIRIASKLVTPTNGLIELNNSDFVKSHAPIKMDKFRKILIDPFYAGIVHIDKQVKVHNENGLHEPLISKAQHLELVNIMNNKHKTQKGPRKGGNPHFQLNNIVSCDNCSDKKYGRYVGYKHSNGKNPKLVYEKYRCRACGRYLSRKELHEKVQRLLDDFTLSIDGQNELMAALNKVWKENEIKSIQEASRTRYKITQLKNTISSRVEAATDPSNITIKDDIMRLIERDKDELSKLEEQLESLAEVADNDKQQFVRFALSFLDQMGSNFFEISAENRLRCKQILFPAGFSIDSKNNVYTPEISPLYRLVTKKKSTEVLNNSSMVRIRRL